MKKKELDKLRVWKLVVFSVITLGAYLIFWLFQTKNNLQKLEIDSKVHSWFLYLFCSTWILGILLIFSNFFLRSLNSFFWLDFTKILCWSASLALLILISFDYKKILDSKLRYGGFTTKLSIFFTLIFNIFYIQYEINRILKNKEHERRTGPIVGAIIIFGIVLPLIIEITLLEVFTEISFFKF